MLRLDFLSSLSNLLEPLEVVLHILNLYVWLHFAVTQYFIVIELVVDVFQKGRNYTFWNLDRQIQHQGPAEVSSRLHQVICAEMVIFPGPYVISTETGLNGINRWAFYLVEQSHSGS
jgi:hypothetical protein